MNFPIYLKDNIYYFRKIVSPTKLILVGVSNNDNEVEIEVKINSKPDENGYGFLVGIALNSFENGKLFEITEEEFLDAYAKAKGKIDSQLFDEVTA